MLFLVFLYSFSIFKRCLRLHCYPSAVISADGLFLAGVKSFSRRVSLQITVEADEPAFNCASGRNHSSFISFPSGRQKSDGY